MSSLLTVVLVFTLILVLTRLKAPLGLSIFLGALAAGGMFGLGPAQLAQTVWAGAVQPDAIGLLVVTIALLGLSATMQAGGQMERLVGLMRQVLRRPAVAMAALPAVIGLLPMPGGAVFSAPMVEAAATGHEIPSSRLSAINYWFRHIWEHWWPLYPGVIVAMTYPPGGTPFLTFAAYQAPLGILMALAGLLILRRVHPSMHAAGPRPAAGVKRQLLIACMPIWMIVVVLAPVSIVLRLFLGEWLKTPVGGAVNTFGPILLGIVVSLVCTTWAGRLSRQTIRDIWTRRSTYSMTGLVLSVMVFQYMLKTVQAAKGMGQELASLHVPMVAVVAALPLIAGAVTGLAVGFVSVSFPIVIPLALAGGDSIRPYIVLAYACGHLGQMISPLHMCHVVSNRYFKTGFGPVYREIVPSALATAGLTLAYVALLYWAMN